MYGDDLQNAIKDYYYLLNREYPEKACLKLVGDRYRLRSEERSILYRGVFSRSSVAARIDKRQRVVVQNRLHIDTFNILFTLVNYFNGRPLFIANDGFLRDAGELGGRIRKTDILTRCMRLICDFIQEHADAEFLFYLDQPVPYSGNTAGKIRDFMRQNNIKGEVVVCRSPDHEIIQRSESKDLICTSDSFIINASSGKAFDISRYLLEKNFQASFPEIRKYTG